ncbi:MAG: ATP-dependent protease [Candidatus Diapherotrites archaeon]|nr:ATP-dependent protease [Candidatus Diapherotrites archaeon]
MKRVFLPLVMLAIVLSIGCLEQGGNVPSIPSISADNASNTSDLKSLQEQVQILSKENLGLKQKLYEMNMSLEHYKTELIAYQEKLRSVTMEGNVSWVSGYAQLDAPAVRQRIEQEGDFPFSYPKTITEGAMLTISAEVKEGRGRIMVVTNPLMGPIFQDAANTAVLVTENKTGVKLDSSDVIFSVNGTNVSEVDGPSAGAVMTTLLIAAVEGKELNQTIAMTGTISQNGSIGAIGGVFEKAQAAKKAGKKLFLLPRGNKVLAKWVETREERGMMTIISRKAVPVDAKEYIEEKVGIKVEYVDNIDDALKHFFINQ